MIDVKQTILSTIKDRIKKMRFLGENDPKILKKIMSLIVIDDLYDWSNYLDAPLAVLKKLQEMRTSYILCLHIFDIEHTPNENYYTNVNVPQTHYTWKRVWDEQQVVTIKDDITPEEKQFEPFIPDYTCPVRFVYFGEGEEYGSKNGLPDVDLNTLTICEKMNIYVDRETSLMYFLDPKTGQWKTINKEMTGTINWDQIVDPPTLYNAITLGVSDNTPSSVSVSLSTEGSQTSSLEMADSNLIDLLL